MSKYERTPSRIIEINNTTAESAMALDDPAANKRALQPFNFGADPIVGFPPHFGTGVQVLDQRPDASRRGAGPSTATKDMAAVSVGYALSGNIRRSERA
jgi:hypothetical protein